MVIGDKIRCQQQKLHNTVIGNILVGLVFFVLGFVLSLGNVINESKPFGISLVAVSKKKYILFSAIGASLGYFIHGFTGEGARYFAGVIIAGIGALAIGSFDLKHSPYLPMAIAFVGDFATGLVLCFKSSGNIYDYILILGESILALGGAFFFYKSINCNYKRLRFKALPISDITCIVISLAIILMNLSSFYIGLVCPARVIGFFLTLCGVYFANDKIGLIIAISFGFSLSIANDGALYLVGALAFSTLLCVLFSSLGCVGIGVSFICSMGFFAVASGCDKMSASIFIESVIASFAFMLIPSKFAIKLEETLDSGKDLPPDGSLRQNLVLKLRFASSAMVAISESVDQVREKINDITRHENELQKDTISKDEYIRNEIILEKTNQIRMVASDQFFSISDMLEDLAFEFDEAEIFNTNASVKIRRLLGDYEIFPKNISAIEDKYGRMRVEILVDNSVTGLTNPKLAEEIGKICSRYFQEGTVTNFKNESMLSFSEKPNYKLSVGFSQHSAQGKLCGDTVKIINDNRGHSILIISDGMGQGSRAALDGAMGAGLISKLINAGFGFDSALKVVNSALLVKSNDESLATLDIANIDLFTGKCEIFKAGAAASYIIKDNSITKCELTSMPAGILRGIEFAKRTAILNPDNCIMLMSDGITDLGDTWLNKTLSTAKNMTVQQGAEYIISSAIEEYKYKKMDDMSVIFAKLERN